MADNWGQRLPRILLLILLASVMAGLVWLGNWQMQRLDWKLDLIERVETRIAAPPVPAPGAADWPEVTTETHEYLRVSLKGKFLHRDETLVQALTERGSGYWVMTPLETVTGEVFLVNRGFVPLAAADPAQREAGQVAGEVEVTGLLRISESGDALFRRNDPSAERWFGRDVEAIMTARGLNRVAPFFIDAEKSAGDGELPVAGLTRTRFRNAHLYYALTWYGLALLLGVMTVFAIRDLRRPD